MTAFLTQLAGTALGHDAPGAAHVVLPPRFAPTAALSPRLPQTEWPHVEPAAAERADAASGQPIQSRRRETDEDINTLPAFSPESKRAPALRVETPASRPSRTDSEIPQQSLPAVAPARSDMPRSSRREDFALPRPPAGTPAPPAQREAAAAPSLFITAAAPPAASLSRRDPPSLPSRSGTGGERLTNAPLALDLHYVMIAYGRADFQAEILLGYGMHLLHERPVLDRAAIRRALNPTPIEVHAVPAHGRG